MQRRLRQCRPHRARGRPRGPAAHVRRPAVAPVGVRAAQAAVDPKKGGSHRRGRYAATEHAEQAYRWVLQVVSLHARQREAAQASRAGGPPPSKCLGSRCTHQAKVSEDESLLLYDAPDKADNQGPQGTLQGVVGCGRAAAGLRVHVVMQWPSVCSWGQPSHQIALGCSHRSDQVGSVKGGLTFDCREGRFVLPSPLREALVTLGWLGGNVGRATEKENPRLLRVLIWPSGSVLRAALSSPSRRARLGRRGDMCD